MSSYNLLKQGDFMKQQPVTLSMFFSHRSGKVADLCCLLEGLEEDVRWMEAPLPSVPAALSTVQYFLQYLLH